MSTIIIDCKDISSSIFKKLNASCQKFLSSLFLPLLKWFLFCKIKIMKELWLALYNSCSENFILTFLFSVNNQIISAWNPFSAMYAGTAAERHYLHKVFLSFAVSLVNNRTWLFSFRKVFLLFQLYNNCVYLFL